MLRSLATAAVLVTCSVVFADDRPPVYNFKLEEPITGSNIRHLVLRSDSRVALNRSYAELSEGEKAIVRSRYESMAPGDEPPYPVDGLLPIYEAIAKASRHLGGRGLRGNLMLVATVNSDGEVGQVQLVGEAVPGIDQIAAHVLAITKFKPALCNGQPCKMDFPLRLSFGR